MELKPDVYKLMRREVYTLLTISAIILIATLILQAFVINLNPDIDNAEFIGNVWPWVAGFLVVLWALVPGLLYLWIVNLSYSIDDERLVIHKGIITKKSVSIPYSAVTDFTLSRSLYERWLKIGTIMIQTAGQSVQTGGSEGKLEGLIDVESIHTNLRAKIKAYRQGAQPETQTAVSNTPVSDIEVLQSILEEVKRIGRKLE